MSNTPNSFTLTETLTSMTTSLIDRLVKQIRLDKQAAINGRSKQCIIDSFDRFENEVTEAINQGVIDAETDEFSFDTAEHQLMHIIDGIMSDYGEYDRGRCDATLSHCDQTYATEHEDYEYRGYVVEQIAIYNKEPVKSLWLSSLNNTSIGCIGVAHCRPGSVTNENEDFVAALYAINPCAEQPVNMNLGKVIDRLADH